jgi:hypothetical protein
MGPRRVRLSNNPGPIDARSDGVSGQERVRRWRWRPRHGPGEVVCVRRRDRGDGNALLPELQARHLGQLTPCKIVCLSYAEKLLVDGARCHHVDLGADCYAG